MRQSFDNEAELVKRVATGSEEAFEELFRAYKNKLYSFSLRYTKSPELAREVVQEAFIKVWEGRCKLDPSQCFGAYLFRITRNQLLNHLKRNAFEAAYKHRLSFFLEASHNPTESDVLSAEYEKIAKEAMAQLPPQRQEIFKMSRVEGLSQLEIAQSLNISTHTVKAQMNKALKAMRSYFQKHADLTLLLIAAWM